MKKASLIVCLVVAFATAAGALAGDKTKDNKQPKPVASSKARKPRVQPAFVETNIVLTGSYIRRDIRRNGKVTDGPSQVVVLDRQTIERSGAADLRQALAHEGIR